MAASRIDDRYEDHGGEWRRDDYALRPGHHYGQPGQAEPEHEPEYDPRAYAPNPDEPYGWDDDGNPLFYEPERPALKGGRSGLVMVGAVLALAVIGGGALVGYKMFASGGSNGEPPLIKADTEPVKTAPKEPGGADVQHQNKAIYDRVDPANAPKSKVVSREEQPVDLPSAPSSEPRPDGSRIILPGGPAAAEPTPPSTNGAEPRRVKTVAIRPDAPIAPPAPATPAVPAPAANDPIAEAARTGQAPRASEFDNGIMSDGDAPLRSSDRPAGPNQTRPAPTAQRSAPQPAPQQAARPAPAPAPAAPAQPPRSDPQQVAAVAPRAPAPAPAQTRPTATGGFVVQVTSQRSEADARSAYANLQKRFPQVLGPYQASIQTATVGDRGTYYRVRVGPFGSSTDASTVCNNLRAAGGDCVVSRN
jgi:cell division protein FtsN